MIKTRNSFITSLIGYVERVDSRDTQCPPSSRHGDSRAFIRSRRNHAERETVWAYTRGEAAICIGRVRGLGPDDDRLVSYRELSNPIRNQFHELREYARWTPRAAEDSCRRF